MPKCILVVLIGAGRHWVGRDDGISDICPRIREEASKKVAYKKLLCSFLDEGYSPSDMEIEKLGAHQTER